jgi:hypothetical protein
LHDQRDTPAADTAESAAEENEKEIVRHGGDNRFAWYLNIMVHIFEAV